MNFLFIYPSPGVLGGIETLLSRMSLWLLNHGHTVSVLTERDDDWKKTLPQNVQCIALGERFRELYYHFHAKRLWESLGLPKPDVIKSFDLGSSWIACELAAIIGNNCKVIAGMYASFLFKWYYAPKALTLFDPTKLFLQNYLKCIPSTARLVCGTDQVEELAEMHRQDCILWPIPLDTSRFEPAARRPKWGKIVSVGRLCAMKEYNFYMVDVVGGLRKKGYEVTWSIFGTGEYEAAIRERIREAKLEDVITMEGNAPYHRFWQVLADAHIFVGMGTSLLEAALFKVPNVYATAYDRVGLTYGPLHRMPPGSIGPSLISPPTVKVLDEIERILKLGPDDYTNEGELNYRHARNHEMDFSMNRFLQLVNEASPVKRSMVRYLINYPRWFAYRSMKSLTAQRDTVHPEAPMYAEAKSPV